MCFKRKPFFFLGVGHNLNMPQLVVWIGLFGGFGGGFPVAPPQELCFLSSPHHLSPRRRAYLTKTTPGRLLDVEQGKGGGASGGKPLRASMAWHTSRSTPCSWAPRTTPSSGLARLGGDASYIPFGLQADYVATQRVRFHVQVSSRNCCLACS